MPPGIPGELCIAGAGLARSYLNRPELTAEKFTEVELFGQVERVYRTGDLTRWLPDGNLEYLGRIDHQVKLRGFRIELGEVEAVLAQHPAVREAVVVLHGQDGNQSLAAYAVLAAVADGEAGEAGAAAVPDPAHLREWLQVRLPDYMVPGSITLLERLPLTPNGKVDRKALPAPVLAVVGSSGFSLPLDPTEALLADLWVEVLKLESAVLSRDADFFALGGHSLLATQLVSRIRDSFGVELPVRSVFEHPSLGDMARSIASSRNSVVLPPLLPRTADTAPILSFAEERLWFIQHYEGQGSATYNIPMALQLDGALDVSALHASLDWLVTRHASLRTCYPPSVEGQAQVALLPASQFHWPVHDLSHLADSAQAAAVQYHADQDAQQPFDLSQGPLFRASLLHLSSQRHVFLITMHHIISDGWSIPLLLDDWVHAYRAFTAGEAPSRPEPTLQYRDYAAWQRQWLQGEVLEQQRAYWLGQLSGAPALLELPTDRPRPAQQDYHGAHYRHRIDPRLPPALYQLARRHGVSLYMLLLAAFNVLLSRHSGQDNIVVGSPIANRTHQHTEALVGLFVNTLVLRTRLPAGQPFTGLLAAVRHTCLDAYAHQDIPFEHLVEQIQPERSLSHSPLFQVMFVLQNNAEAKLELPGLHATPLAQAYPVAKFDLTLSLAEQDGQLYCEWEYATALFDRSTIARWAGHLETLLAGIVARPDSALQHLPLLSAAERQQLQAWNDTAVDYPPDQTIVSLFEAQVQRTPDNTAVVFEGQHLTYAELNARANQVAHHLRQHQVFTAPNPLIALCVERSLEMVVGLLGILKAGGAYVPLDPAYPDTRLRYMLSDCGAGLLLTQSGLQDKLAGIMAGEDGSISSYAGCELLCLDTTGFSHHPTRNLPLQAQPADLAYVIYTSGSTGKPKGVMIEHRQLANFLLDMQTRAAIQVSDRLLSVTTLAFDIAALELYLPLISGSRIYLATQATASDPQALQQMLAVNGISLMQATPATWQLLRHYGWQAAAPLTLFCGGEALPPELGNYLLANSTALWNVYGPTETTVWSSAYRIAESLCGHPAIGKPIANTRIHILDTHQQPVPPGIPGELCIAGVGLARGYLNRPALTAEKFIEVEIFGQVERVYRTGDLARWLPDGNLEYLGRIDHQVKLRGFRIELGEVEAVLSQHPAVREAVVVLHEQDGNKSLAAYAVLAAVADGEAGKAGAATAIPDPAHLREWLQTRLPDYMVPGSITLLERLPLTPNGKVDRKALPAPERLSGLSTEGNALCTPTEHLLAALWAGVLKLEVGVLHADAHFFALGGHSLLATQLAARVREAFAVELPLRSIFAEPTLSGMAVWLDSQQKGGILPPLVAQPENAPKYPSFIQQQFWLLNQLDAQAAVHHMSYAWQLTGQLDTAALHQTLTVLVERHESLRLFFPAQHHGSQVEVLLPYDPWQFTDLSELDCTAQQAALQTLRVEHRQTPFDLATGPLLRLHVIKTTAQQHVLLLTVHHIIFDHWSVTILLKEWRELYQASQHQIIPALPTLPVQYTDYAAWQRAYLQGEELQRQLSYWQQQLAHTPELLHLPLDHLRPLAPKQQGAVATFHLPASLITPLQQLAVQYHCTLQMVLFSAFACLLNRYSGQQDFCIGIPKSNRTHQATEHMVGLFLTVLALRTTFRKGQTFVDLLQQVRQQMLEAYAHSDIPFETILQTLKPQRHPNYHPYIQVLFNLVNTPDDHPFTLEGMEVQPWIDTDGFEQQGMSNMDLVLQLNESAQGIHGMLIYDKTLFDITTIDQWLEGFRFLLSQVVTTPEKPLRQLAFSAEATYSLTASQREIWFDQMLNADIPLYNIGGYVKIPGQLDVALFEQAANLLVQKHDALRTILIAEHDEDGLPLQQIVTDLAVQVAVQDVSRQADPHAAALAWMQTRFEQPFALTGQPLFRYDLVKLAEDSYYWLLQYHHLILDGWGVALVNRSLAAIYTALAQGEVPDLSSPSYIPFIDDDRQYVKSSLFQTQRDYWLEKYSTPPEPLLTPRYHAQYAGERVGSGCETLFLPRDLYQRLAGLAQRHNATLFHVLLGALYVYFTRTAQREDFAIGLPVLNRANARFRQTAGLFVGVSPAVFQVPHDASFGELLQHISKTLKANYRHQRFPVSELNRAVGLEQGRSQLFDVNLSYEQHDNSMMFGEVLGQLIPLLHGYEQTPLLLFVRDFHTHDAVHCDFVYNRAYFNAEEVHALQARFVTLLEAVLEQDQRLLHQLPIMTKAECQQLQAWNDIAVDYPPDQTIVSLFEAQVARTPDNTAVVFEDTALTYAELNARANRLAHHLRQHPAFTAHNPLIALCVERSLDMVVGLLGILKAGGAYVPLDPAYPDERLRYMFSDCGAQLLLTHSGLQDKLARIMAGEEGQSGSEGQGCERLCLDTTDFSHHPARNLPLQAQPADLAYVIYTSGSTGKPKGVMLQHEGLYNLAHAQIQAFAVQTDSRVLQFASSNFDASVWEWVMALGSGAGLYLASRDALMPGDALQATLLHHAITHILLPPTALTVMSTSAFTSVSHLVVGGEACPVELATEWSVGRQFFNAYGPTETTVCATVARCQQPSGSLPIGKPLPNTRIHILDTHQQPVPPGIPGELCIAGVGLARGYLNRPALTAEKFIEVEIFGQVERVYRTGDLARWLPDGNLEYLGRIDHQVKLRGFRIELGEVEAVLSLHPAVREAVVVLHEQKGNKSLAAYAVLAAEGSTASAKDGYPADAAALRQWLQARLPDYMVPGSITLLERLPLTPNGKIDRKALQQQTNAALRVVDQLTFVPPKTETEICLASIWGEVLRLDQIGRYDSFFALGGHSLIAVQVISRIRERLGIELPIKMLFQYPMLKDLAEQLPNGQQPTQCSITACQLRLEEPQELSLTEQELWMVEQQYPEASSMYNIGFGYQLKGNLNRVLLQDSVHYLAEKHTILYGYLQQDGNRVFRVADKTFTLPFRYIDLRSFTNATRTAVAETYLTNLANAHLFGFGKPLWECLLLQTDEDEYLFSYINHHIISDGWSLGIISQEIARHYKTLISGAVVDAQCQGLSHQDFSHWQNNYFKGSDNLPERSFWCKTLANLPEPIVFTGRPIPKRRAFNGLDHAIFLPHHLFGRLTSFSQTRQITLFTLLLAAFKLSLAIYTQSRDIIVGTPFANRTQRELEDKVGFFVNTLPIRTLVNDGMTGYEFLEQVNQNGLAVIAHQHTPFVKLLEWTQAPIPEGQAPIHQVIFALQNTPEAGIDFGEGLVVTPLSPVAGMEHQVEFDLFMSLVETNNGIEGGLAYRVDIFDPIWIADFCDHYQQLLEGLVGAPDKPVSHLINTRQVAIAPDSAEETAC